MNLAPYPFADFIFRNITLIYREFHITHLLFPDLFYGLDFAVQFMEKGILNICAIRIGTFNNYFVKISLEYDIMYKTILVFLLWKEFNITEKKT